MKIILSIIIIILGSLLVYQQYRHEKRYEERQKEIVLLEKEVDVLENKISKYEKPTGSGLERVTNEYRISKGLNKLEKSMETCEIAEDRLKDMKDGFSHFGFDNKSNLYFKKFPNLLNLGENLIRGYEDNLYEAMYRLLVSKTHRENIEGKYTYMCVKCENKYCVQIFSD